MSRRLLQAIAGARHGGAETFFVRLAVALERAGEEQRVLIRRDRDRSRRLRAAGVAVAELAFGGRIDVMTRLAFRRQIAAFRPDIVMTWMSRATSLCPRGDFVHVARLGGYYDLKYYRHCDYLIGNKDAGQVRDGHRPARRRPGQREHGGGHREDQHRPRISGATLRRWSEVGRPHAGRGRARLRLALRVLVEHRLGRRARRPAWGAGRGRFAQARRA